MHFNISRTTELTWPFGSWIRGAQVEYIAINFCNAFYCRWWCTLWDTLRWKKLHVQMMGCDCFVKSKFARYCFSNKANLHGRIIIIEKFHCLVAASINQTCNAVPPSVEFKLTAIEGTIRFFCWFRHSLFQMVVAMCPMV